MHQERNGTLLYPQSLNADPKPLSHKSFTINVKIPLISLKEWREISSGLHVNDGSYTQKEARAMSKLAERKAQGIFV